MSIGDLWAGHFTYGSTIYGTADENSDVDVAIIGGEESDDGTSTVYRSLGHFMAMVRECDPVALEGYSMQFHDDPELKKLWTYRGFKLDISLEVLRQTISAKASNSFVKAKKKLTVEKDYDRRSSMKSLFHAIRLYDFGKQVADYGYVKNFKSCVDIWAEIVDTYSKCNDEEIIEKIGSHFKPIFNSYASEFRKSAPKGGK